MTLRLRKIRINYFILEIFLLPGFFVGDPWMYKQKAKTKSKRGEFVCNGPYCEYYKVGCGNKVIVNYKRSPHLRNALHYSQTQRPLPKWLEIAVVADWSVVNFHRNGSG